MIFSVNPSTPQEAIDLVRKNPDDLMKMCYRIFSKSRDCEDLMNDFFIHLVDHALLEYNGSTKLSTFISVCARQYFLNYLKKNRRNNYRFPQEKDYECPSLEERNHNRPIKKPYRSDLMGYALPEMVRSKDLPLHQQAIIKETLEALNPSLRRIIEAEYLTNERMEDVAKELGISTTTAYNRLNKWREDRKLANVS